MEAVLLLEVVKLGRIRQVKAHREERVDLYVVPPYEVLEAVAQAHLGRYHVVLHEVIRDLKLFQLGRVVRLDRKLKVKDRRLLVRVLVPAPLDKCFSQCPVATANDEDFDVWC